MNNDEIIEIIKQTLTQSPVDFESVANGNTGYDGLYAERMPEFWVVALLMKRLHTQGLAAFPEVQINHDLNNFWINGAELNPKCFEKLKGAKIDLFIADSSSNSGHLQLRVVMELKGPKSNWEGFERDLFRLKEFQKGIVNDPSVTFVFAYVTSQLNEKEIEKETNKYKEKTKLEETQFIRIPATFDSKYIGKRSQIYLYIF